VALAHLLLHSGEATALGLHLLVGVMFLAQLLQPTTQLQDLILQLEK
jgi:hypothetical protein